MNNKKNLIRLFMFQTVFGFATKNQTITNMIIAFKGGIVSLGEIINQLLALAQQPANVVGGGDQNRYLRNGLNLQSWIILKAARGYFLSVNNFDMAAQLKYSKADMRKIYDKDMFAKVKSWVTLMQPFMTNLKDWNITAATITGWQAANQVFSDATLIPKTKIMTRRSRNRQINALIEQGMALCTNMLDSAAVGFTTNGNQVFYNDYTDLRRLTPMSSRHGKFRILVLDDLNQPVVNVVCKQDNTTNKTSTDLNGQASMDIIYNKATAGEQANLYSFTLSSGTKTINSGYIQIKHNETVTRTYSLEPSGFIIPKYQPAVIKVNVPA